jgi:hypothetical protein
MTKNKASGMSRRDEIMATVLKVVSSELTNSDFHMVMRTYGQASTGINEVEELGAPFRELLDRFRMAVIELADADLADSRLTDKHHPAFMTREQCLARTRLAALVAHEKVKPALQAVLPLLPQARAAVRGHVMPQSTTTAVVITNLLAVETLCQVAKVFCAMQWKNSLADKSDAEIRSLLDPLFYLYESKSVNSPALYVSIFKTVQMVNLGDFMYGFETKTGHFLVRRKIDSEVPGQYDTDWALTQHPAPHETIYRGDDFIARNSIKLDHHQSPCGVEGNEQILQEFSHPHESMLYSRWLK